MSQNNGPRVLAVALDAAEPSLIRRMIEEDELPALESVLSKGRWMSVRAPAHVGSGSVWPTFMSGCDPSVHGVYGEWCWHPDTMSLSRYQGGELTAYITIVSRPLISVPPEPTWFRVASHVLGKGAKRPSAVALER